MEKAYGDSNFHLDFIRDVENFLENKSDEERKLVIDGLYNDAIHFKTEIKRWSYKPLTKWLQDRQFQSQQTLSKTTFSDNAMQKQHRKKKIYKSLDELVDKEDLDGIVEKLTNKGYINRSKKNEIRFIDPSLGKKALIRKLVIVGIIIIENYINTTCSDYELWIALTKYFNVKGSYQNFKNSERVFAETYRKEFAFLPPT